MKQRAIVLLGMHRSGTSATTRVISLLGAHLPNNLMPAAADNETGFWESHDIAVLNEEILASAGLSWDSFSAFPQSWYASDSVQGFAQRALALLHRDFSQSPLFVLKDPRFCRLIPFWRDVL